MKTYLKCPLCNSGHFHNQLSIKDHSVSREIFNISRCEQCSFLFTNPIPDQESIGSYYKSDTYISHTNKANTPINLLYKAIRSHTMKKKVRLLRSFKGNSLLDVGCGTGMFLTKSMNAGFDCKGVETDEIARKNQPQQLNNQMFNSIKALPQDIQFDFITLWHVLEHIHDLQEHFSQLVSKLNNNGHIIIAVPNPESWDKCHYQEYWAAWDVPRHLYHFKKQNIKLLFENNGITLVDIKPMKWDSYYVSMLSENYKGRSVIKQLIYGFISGFVSNFKAGKQNHSSLIYIGKKND